MCIRDRGGRRAALPRGTERHMPESDSAHRGDEALEGAIVEEAIKQRRDNAAVTFGAVLVVIGAVLLGARFNDVVAAGGPALWIGLGCLTWWAFSGDYGLLVPAGVLTGLGVGLMLDHAEFYGNPCLLYTSDAADALTRVDL